MVTLRLLLRLMGKLPFAARGFAYAEKYEEPPRQINPVAASNRLREFFDGRTTGRGIWKWEHYFDIYDRHFAKFVDKSPSVLEIGVLGGGSLDMWRHYFGDVALYGADINPACRGYEDAHTKMFIGDQADREFWKAFKRSVPRLDIVVDDGGHRPEQQIATFEELLPHLQPGGVYLCEDMHGEHNGFCTYMHGVVKRMNAMTGAKPSEFQRWIRSVHFYPYVTVIEKTAQPVEQFVAPKHGTEWSPSTRA
jgi:hypothetical protein